MLAEWLNNLWGSFIDYIRNAPPALQGNPDPQKQTTPSTEEPICTKQIKMSDMQVALTNTGNKEVETESSSETTLTQISKDLGHTKSLEKTAKYEENESTLVTEENRTQSSESSRTLVQSETQTVSANRQVTSSRIETSESFSMEETEEYEIEG